MDLREEKRNEYLMDAQQEEFEHRMLSEDYDFFVEFHSVQIDEIMKNLDFLKNQLESYGYESDNKSLLELIGF